MVSAGTIRVCVKILIDHHNEVNEDPSFIMNPLKTPIKHLIKILRNNRTHHWKRYRMRRKPSEEEAFLASKIFKEKTEQIGELGLALNNYMIVQSTSKPLPSATVDEPSTRGGPSVSTGTR